MGGPTIVGGATLQVSLDGTELTYAESAIAVAEQSYTAGYVLASVADAAPPGAFDAYDIDPAAGQSVTAPSGGQALALYGQESAKLVGGPSSDLLIGNAGDDTIDAAGGSGTIIAGPGGSSISLGAAGAGGSQYIVTGPRTDTVNMYGGQATIVGGAVDLINLRAGDNSLVGVSDIDVQVVGGENDVDLQQPSQVEILAAGNDTISAGSGVTGSLVSIDQTGALNLYLAGAGADRVIVKAGTNDIAASAPADFSLEGGDNAVTLAGGGDVTILGGANALTLGGDNSDVSEKGGTNVINFGPDQNDTIDATGSDTISLGGADSVSVRGGANTITETGFGDQVELSGGGSDTIEKGVLVNVLDAASYDLVSDNGDDDTIDFGSGRDTIVMSGTATVRAVGGDVTVRALNAALHAYGGSGDSTFVGGVDGGVGLGQGDDTFAGGGGATVMIGGLAANEFIGGTGDDTMDAGAGVTNYFLFASTQSGGAHLIENFQQGRCHIELGGYDSAAALAGAQVIGGDTVITLDGGATKIILEGFTDLQADDFSTFTEPSLSEAAKSAKTSAAPSPRPAAETASVTWTGLAGDDQFGDAGNWNTGVAPGADDIAVLTGQTVMSSQDETVAGLDIPSAALVIAGGDFSAPGGTIANSGTIEVTGGELTLATTDIVGGVLDDDGGQIATSDSGSVLDGGARSGAVTIQGAVQVTDGDALTLLGSIVNEGTLAVNGARDPTELLVGPGGATLSGGGTVAMTGSQTLLASAGGAAATLTNLDDTITSTGQGVFIGYGDLDLVNAAQGVIDAAKWQVMLRTPAPVTNAGLIEATGSGDLLVIDTIIDSSGGGAVAAQGVGGNDAGAAISLDGARLEGGTLSIGAGDEVEADIGASVVEAGAVTNAGVLGANNVGLTLRTTVTDQGGVILAIGADVVLASAVIEGGALQTESGGLIVAGDNRSVLEGATSAGAVTNQGVISIGGGTGLTLAGAIDNTAAGVIEVAGGIPGGRLYIAAAGATLSGGGRLRLYGGAVEGVTAAASLTNVDNVISGWGEVGDGELVLVNGPSGVVDAASAGRALVLDTGAGTIVNGGLIEADGAGALTIESPVSNGGELKVDGGVLLAEEAVTGAGTAVIAAGTLQFDSSFDQDVRFTGTTGTLVLFQSVDYAGVVTGFAAAGGMRLDLRDVGFSSASEASFSGSASGGVLTVAGAAGAAHIELAGDYLGATFVASSDGHGGVMITCAPTAPSSASAFVQAMAAFGHGGSTALDIPIVRHPPPPAALAISRP